MDPPSKKIIKWTGSKRKLNGRKKHIEI